MAPDPQGQEPKQKTHPKKGKPVEVPVPKREDVERDDLRPDERAEVERSFDQREREVEGQ